jgi:hypothetical protein
MNFFHKFLSFAFIALVLSIPAFSSRAAASSASMSVGLTIETYIDYTVENGTLVVKTNSSSPISIFQDDVLLPEKAYFGKIAYIPMDPQASYTFVPGI